jgi:hypothetical protein
VTGIVERTLLRGHEIFANGEIIGASRGQPLLKKE